MSRRSFVPTLISYCTANAVIEGRLDSFRNQYGFARNMAFALITSAIAILAARQLGDPFVHLRWALLASVPESPSSTAIQSSFGNIPTSYSCDTQS